MSLPASWNLAFPAGILAFPAGILAFPAGRQRTGSSIAATGSHRHLQPAGCVPSRRWGGPRTCSLGQRVCATQPQRPSDAARPGWLMFNKETTPFPG